MEADGFDGAKPDLGANFLKARRISGKQPAADEREDALTSLAFGSAGHEAKDIRNISYIR